MDIEELYTQFYTEAKEQICSGFYQIDPLIDSTNDTRRGLTLIMRPSGEVKSKFELFLNELKYHEPNQYFYPTSDLHTTVISVISCYPGFDVSGINISEYIQLIRKCISNFQSFNISYKGITASPACLMICGYSENDALNDLRDKIRAEFQKSSLFYDIDKRYKIQTAHSTLVRFKSNLIDPKKLMQITDKWLNFSFGTCPVNEIELAITDWYFRKDKISILETFNLL